MLPGVEVKQLTTYPDERGLIAEEPQWFPRGPLPLGATLVSAGTNSHGPAQQGLTSGPG
ncbi:MAG TPA: hypothetical protein VKE27_08810 [Candidatus Dormibacteraeota bacterium]|nr:hypothetical protein [Candidatus Dormibacteraeota bacterium]